MAAEPLDCLESELGDEVPYRQLVRNWCAFFFLNDFAFAA
jgi:hypothetical protein